jgi:superfamily I DNA/RNA helicase
VVRSGKSRYSADAVSLMTLHGAKGLEFPVVFLCGVTDSFIPLQNREGEIDADEERRLFYVGLTRAQDDLILLTSGTPSPFLADIPVGALSPGKTFIPRQGPGFTQLSLFGGECHS